VGPEACCPHREGGPAVHGKKKDQNALPPPYSPDLAPADNFLFPKLKKELTCIPMTQEEFKKEWEGVLRGVSREEFEKAFVH
jgi:hypothetical protein